MNELGESEDEEDSDNGDYDTKIDITVSSDRIVASPDTQPTKASYKPNNWVERNRIGLEKNEGTAAELCQLGGTAAELYQLGDAWYKVQPTFETQ